MPERRIGYGLAIDVRLPLGHDAGRSLLTRKDARSPMARCSSYPRCRDRMQYVTDVALKTPGDYGAIRSTVGPLHFDVEAIGAAHSVVQRASSGRQRARAVASTCRCTTASNSH